MYEYMYMILPAIDVEEFGAFNLIKSYLGLKRNK